MSIRITDTAMTSDTTPAPRRAAARGVAGVVAAAQRLNRDQAVTAMTLAEAVARMQREGRTHGGGPHPPAVATRRRVGGRAWADRPRCGGPGVGTSARRTGQRRVQRRKVRGRGGSR